jgi:hypothetical protein
MKKTSLLLLLFISVLSAEAQELNATVKVMYQKVTDVDPSIFKALETSVTQFLNNTRWTSDVYGPEERIECSFLINITDAKSPESFVAELTVGSRRPVYGSAFFCSMLNVKDMDFDFTYVPFQPMEFSETSFLNNLTSVLSYYAFIILAMDYDSFSPDGGSAFYTKANQIVQNAQQTPELGWKSFDSGGRNRYTLSEDLLNPAFKNFRTFLFKYHREGFDHFYNDFEKSRTKAIEALLSIEEIFKQRPNSFLLQVFFNSKRDEAINMLKDAPLIEKQNLVQVMRKVDGANASRWDELLKN